MNLAAIPTRLSPNRNARPFPAIGAIILHATGGPTLEGAVAWFEHRDSQVSAHYVLDVDGRIVRCVPDLERAWHAGASELWGRPDLNSWSLGLELVSAQAEPVRYPEAQVAAAAELVATLCRTYAIPLNGVVAHAQVATPPGRKVDPLAWDHYAFGLAVAHALVRGAETPQKGWPP